MKRITMLLLFVFFIVVTSTHALSWAYPFVVWNGNVYEVTDEEIIDSLLGKKIGVVKTKPNDMTGNYYGNASNIYPKGTAYFEISGVPTETEIAVEVEERQWAKAVYSHEAPFHWMNVVTSVIPYLLLFVVIGYIVKKRKKAKNKV